MILSDLQLVRLFFRLGLNVLMPTPLCGDVSPVWETKLLEHSPENQC